jgi:hypothetical protein
MSQANEEKFAELIVSDPALSPQPAGELTELELEIVAGGGLPPATGLGSSTASLNQLRTKQELAAGSGSLLPINPELFKTKSS